MISAHRHHADDNHRFDAWSRSYDRSPAQTVFFSRVHRSLIGAVTGRAGSGRVLDIGAGTGRLLERLGAEIPGLSLFGIDRSQGMLTEGHRARPHLSLVRGTAESLPFPDGSFDLVTTTVSFHHWGGQAAGLVEVRRVLRRGGVLALADPATDDYPRWFRRVPLLARRGDGHILSLEERHELLAAAGFRIVHERGTVFGRWVPLTVAEPVAG